MSTEQAATFRFACSVKYVSARIWCLHKTNTCLLNTVRTLISESSACCLSVPAQQCIKVSNSSAPAAPYQSLITAARTFSPLTAAPPPSNAPFLLESQLSEPGTVGIKAFRNRLPAAETAGSWQSMGEQWIIPATQTSLNLLEKEEWRGKRR